jgi:hypothetical protein
MDKAKTPFVVTIDVVFQTSAIDENHASDIAENLLHYVSQRIKCDDMKVGDIYANPET